MARAHAVWVVMDKDKFPIAAFTVKHELVTWIERQFMGALAHCVIWKLPDGFRLTVMDDPRPAARDVTNEFMKSGSQLPDEHWGSSAPY
jgi:hypothetical protein